jgi:hypothetical protein
VLAAAAPIFMSLAALTGWTTPLMVVALYVILELFTNLVLETALYAGAAGVSQVALLVSVAFWTWLWGPMGLLLATPLTVCLVVLGKHVPGLEFLGTLMADRPALAPEYNYYQRLLAKDQSEGADLIEAHIKAESPRTVYDALLLPALNYAERDRIEERLSPGEEAAIVDSTRELIVDAAQSIRRVEGAATPRAEPAASTIAPPPARPKLPVFGYAVNGAGDELALQMLARIVDDLPIHVEINGARLLVSEVIALVQDREYSTVCIADLPPSPPSKTRYLVRRLRAALPELRIIVGRWGPASLTDDSTQKIRDAGASRVDTVLLDTRNYLEGLLETPRTTVEDTTGTHAA